MTRLQSAVDQYETLISEFKAQIDKYRKENDDLSEKLYQKEKEMKKQLHQSTSENEKVRPPNLYAEVRNGLSLPAA